MSDDAEPFDESEFDDDVLGASTKDGDDDDEDATTKLRRRFATMRAHYVARRVENERLTTLFARRCVCATLSVVWTAFLVVGAVLAGHADSIVETGYAPTVCRIAAEHSLEATCAYYNVTLSIHEPGSNASALHDVAACALIATVAREARPGDARACTGDVARDRARYANATQVECFAPRASASIVTADRCAAAATSFGRWAEFEHARGDNFVYLGTVTEGRGAVRAATAAQRELGVWLALGGSVALVATTAFACSSSVVEYCARGKHHDAQLIDARRARSRRVKDAVE